MQVFQIPALKDNYIHILRNEDETAVIDPSESQLVNNFLQEKGWSLDFILNTHHHWDHTDGNKELKKKWNCLVMGFAQDAHRIPEIDRSLKENEIWKWKDQTCQIFFIPGHTLGHIAFWFKNPSRLFCGDTLFAMGCGRLFEGTPEQMLKSLKLLEKLPSNTEVYCGHEYSENNARFALQIEGNNTDLKERQKIILQKRKQNQSTVPFLLKDELKTNPFLRTKILIQNTEKITHPQLKKWVTQHSSLSELDLFKQIRTLKDNF